MAESIFSILNSVNCNEHTEKKQGLTYLSWAWAWGEVKKRYPQATYKVYEAENGCIYFTDGETCWVKTGVTIEGLEHIEYLPVMDYKNNSIPIERVTSFDVNKAIQRSLTKACARHGLGLYIYAGEDLPESPDQTEQKPIEKKKATPAAKQAPKPSHVFTLKEKDPDKYWQFVHCEAENIRCKSGKTLKQFFIENYKPGAKELAEFVADVEDSRIGMAAAEQAVYEDSFNNQ